MRRPDDVVDALFHHYVLVGLGDVGRRVTKLNPLSVADLIGMLEVACVANAGDISRSLHETAARIFEIYGDSLNETNYSLPRLFRARISNDRNVRVRTNHHRQFSNFLTITWELENEPLRRINLNWSTELEDPELHSDILTSALSTPDTLATILARPKESALESERFIDDVLRLLQFVWALDGVFEESEDEFKIVAWNYHGRLLARPGLSAALIETAHRLGSWTDAGESLARAAERICGGDAQDRFAIATDGTS